MKKKAKKIVKKVKKIEWTEYHMNRQNMAKIFTIGFFVFLGYLIVVPPQPDISNNQLVMQFHGTPTERGVNEKVHGAADDRRKYLFDNQTTTAPQALVTTTTPSTLPTTTQTKYVKIISEIPAVYNYYVETALVFDATLAKYYLEHFLEGDRSMLGVVGKTFDNCTDPRGEEVKHGGFVIAYQQREDVTTVCNVEKRYCNDGTLEGSFAQNFCNEKATYAYEKVEPVSYNESKPGEYAQPSEPSNSYGEFNSQGQVGNELEPTTWREDEPAEAIVVNNESVEQTVVDYPDCRAPWGGKVLNGQFVKAYKNKKGYFNWPCQVELRMCTDGKLSGKFKYKTCTSTGASYQGTIPASNY